jgi:deoxyribodipyrimidine photolyase-related protein
MINDSNKLRLILGDQLNATHPWFEKVDDNCLYVIAELHQETNYVTHHLQKVQAFFCSNDSICSGIKKGRASSFTFNLR